MLRLFISTILVLGIVVVGQQYIENQELDNLIGSLYPNVAPTVNREVNHNPNEQDLNLLINSIFTTEPTIRNVAPTISRQVNSSPNEQDVNSYINSLFITEPNVATVLLPQNIPVTPSEQEIKALIDSIFTTEPTIRNIKPPINGNVNPKIVPLVSPQVPTTQLPITKSLSGVELPPGVPMENRCLHGECIVYYQCANNTINTSGEGLIDIRFSVDKPRDCHHYLEVCCSNEDISSELTNLIPPPENKQDGCGYRNSEGVSYKINGTDSEAQYGEFPWMVAIMKEELGGDKILSIYQCGGSLIHPQVVLTAAHCVQNRSVNTIKIRAGEWDTQTKNEMFPDQNRDVVDIVVHPQYHNGALHNDIALLFLNSPVELIDNVQTICLPPQNAVFDYSRCTATGWGKDVFGRQGKYQVILKKVELPIVPRSSCTNSLRSTRLGKRFILHESFICAGGEPGKDMCKGDGGSPLVCPIQNEPDRYYQSGIVAWGIGCGENGLPGVYANIALFRNWIDQQFAQRGLHSSHYTA